MVEQPADRKLDFFSIRLSVVEKGVLYMNGARIGALGDRLLCSGRLYLVMIEIANENINISRITHADYISKGLTAL